MPTGPRTTAHASIAKVGRRRAARLLLAPLVLALLACGGSEEDDDPGCLFVDFAPANLAPSDADVYLLEVGSSCTTVEVAVMIRNLSGIWTVGFDLTYPSANVTYTGYSLGPLLQQNSTGPVIAIVTGSTGRVEVGLNRYPPDPAVTASGSAVLLTLRFSKVAGGSGMIDFDTSSGSAIAEQILDASGTPRPASFGPGHGGLVTVPFQLGGGF
jgi:hypothetical protein